MFAPPQTRRRPCRPRRRMGVGQAASRPSVTKSYVVPPALGSGARDSCVTTDTGVPEGGGSPHGSTPTSNIRLPIRTAPVVAAISSTIAASVAVFSENIQSCRAAGVISEGVVASRVGFGDEPIQRHRHVGRDLAYALSAPPAGFEPAPPAPEAGALSPELRGLEGAVYPPRIAPRGWRVPSSTGTTHDHEQTTHTGAGTIRACRGCCSPTTTRSCIGSWRSTSGSRGSRSSRWAAATPRSSASSPRLPTRSCSTRRCPGWTVTRSTDGSERCPRSRSSP